MRCVLNGPRGALMWAVLALGALPMLLLVDSACAAARGWRPLGSIEHGVLGALLLAALAIAGAAAFPVARRALRRRWAEMVLLCGSCVVAAGLVEVAAFKARDVLVPRAEFHTRGPNLARVFEPAPGTMPGINGPGHYTTDATGVRTPGAPRDRDAYQILCIGGSTTECVYLDDRATWPARVMQYLNEAQGEHRVWVGNVGFSGFATLDHIALLRDSRLLDDVDCVVIQPGINDLYPVLAGKALELHVNRNARRPRTRPLWARSNLIALYHALRRTAPVGAGVEDRDGAEYATRRAKRRDAPKRERGPDLSAAVQAYQARLRILIELARERALRIVYTTQPALWAKGLPQEAEALCWFGWLEDGACLSIPALRDALDTYNAALQAVCDELGVLCVDLSAMDGQPAYFYDDCHFSEAGARQVGRAVADALVRGVIAGGDRTDQSDRSDRSDRSWARPRSRRGSTGRRGTGTTGASANAGSPETGRFRVPAIRT